MRDGKELIAGEADATRFDGLGKTAADRPENKSGDIAFRLHGEVGSFAGKLEAAIELETSLLEEFSGETEVGGTVHPPKPEFLFVPLEELQGFLELFHGAVEG